MLIQTLAGVGLACGIGLGLHVSPYPFKLQQIRELNRVCVQNRWVALTFDDGPGPTLTPKVLDILAEADIPATFFLLGRRVQRHPEVLDDLRSGGHELASHSMNHCNAWKSSPWAAYRDVVEGVHALSDWVPADGLFRPPHGKLSIASWAALKKMGSHVGWWTIDSGDTFRNLPDPQMGARILKERGGGVVLLHDFDRKDPNRTEFVLESTRALTAVIRDEGLSPQKLGDILRLGGSRQHERT